jgi:predicted metal-dependent phosphoesterase TrpH
MPSRQPFTALCRSVALDRFGARADLHLHSTHSDGAYTPAELVDLARRSGLAAISITDHDTFTALKPAQEAAGSALEIIPGVEITAEDRAREFHLLGYYFRTDDQALNAALAKLRAHRAGRFWDMVERLRSCGVSLDEEDLQAQATESSLGRRHLASLLVKDRHVGTVQEAFVRYLSDGGRVTVPKMRLPVGEAIALVRGAGGVASWAHPPYDGVREDLVRLRDLGLQAVEVEYPSCRLSRRRQLRSWAAELGMAVTGGSDCHGPGGVRRTVGACGVSRRELDVIRQLALN